MEGSPPPMTVYDSVPQGAARPYVAFDRQIAEPHESEPLGSRRDTRFIYLSVWSDYRGQKEVVEIIEAIDARLHRSKLTLATGRMVRCEVLRRVTTPEPDNLTFQGQITLRIITEH